MKQLDLADLGLDEGAHLLLRRALAGIEVGEHLTVTGSAPALAVHLGAWCRAEGHRFASGGGALSVQRGVADVRRQSAERAGGSDPLSPGAVHDRPDPRWGLAARGALVEAGAPRFDFTLDDKAALWTDDAGRIYRQAVAAQWDPASAIDWSAPVTHDDAIEDAVVQVMTYLIENETAALLVPARFLGRIHPHFREVMQVLSVQVADEARHIEVFTRRATLRRQDLGLSTVGGQASLQTLFEEPDFALASFLLSVLGEGTFLALLQFLHAHAPDPVTRRVAELAARDEARHVAFGMGHLLRHLAHEPDLRPRLAAVIERRHQALRDTAGLNDLVFDALLLLAAGSFEPAAIRTGHERMMGLVKDMAEGRTRRLMLLGFAADEAQALSALHTRNFM